MNEPADRPPEPLRPDVAALVAAYRRGRAPAPAIESRMWDRLASTSPVAAANWPMRAAVLAAAVVLGVFAVRWWTPDAVHEGTGPAPDQAIESVVDTTAAEPVHERAPLPTKPAGSSTSARPSVTPPPADLPVVEPVDAEPDRRRRRRPTEPAPGTELDQLIRERDLIAKAWGALSAGDGSEATRWAKQHAREFPDGILGPERRALIVIVDCQASRAGAGARARKWLDQQPRSPLVARVRNACEIE